MSKTRAPNGSCNPKKVTRVSHGKSYTYWEAKITTGYSPSTGKQIQKTLRGKTKTEVMEQVYQLQYELKQGNYDVRGGEQTLGEWLEHWEENYRNRKAYHTRRTEKAAIETHIKPRLGQIKLKNLTPDEIQRFVNGLEKSGKKQIVLDAEGKPVIQKGERVYTYVPLATKTVRNIVGILSAALSQAVRNKYIPENTVACIEHIPLEKTEMHPLSNEQIAAYTAAANDDPYGRMLQFILFMGLRESEAIGLTFDRIDFEGGTISIDRQLVSKKLSDGGRCFALPKHNKTRVLHMPPFIAELLRQQRIEKDRMRIQADYLWKGYSIDGHEADFVFCTTEGLPISTTTLRNHHDHIRKTIGASECRLHDLRHTYATICLQNGDDIKTLSVNMGHSSVAFTLDRYGHSTSRMKEDSAQRMQAFYSQNNF